MRSISKAGLLLGAASAVIVAGAGVASADSTAVGAAFDSPGVLSGNVIQIPVDVDANVCGNSLNVIGLLNPAFGNTCVNGGGPKSDWHPSSWHQHFWDMARHHHGDDCDDH
jgi:hypothetical protein